jgi:hypothetical protein
MKKNLDGYLRVINETWAVKEKIAQETEGMDFTQYLQYVEEHIVDLKKRFQYKYVSETKDIELKSEIDRKNKPY